MIITVCPDSYKGSLTSKQAAHIMQKACLTTFPEAKVFMRPMADGGEGTVDALIEATGGKRVYKEVTNALGKRVTKYYGFDEQNNVAFLEVANIAGITELKDDDKNPYETTSYGVGEMLSYILDDGIKKVVVGLGGSATNDGGMGFLKALGVKFFDETNRELAGFGKDLIRVKHVDFSNIDQRLQHAEIQVANDVTNPLCGEQGASLVFGPQKGATEKQALKLDEAMNRYSSLIEKTLQKSFKDVRGAGAAGGLGFALLSIGGKLIPGAKLISDVLQLEDAIRQSEFVLTGEGKSDEQTVYGKAPKYVSELSQKYNTPVILISGAIEDGSVLRKHFTATFSIVNKPMSLQEAIEEAEKLLYEQTLNICQFFKTIHH